MGGDVLSSAPGGPITEISSQSPKSPNSQPAVRSAGPRVDTSPSKAQSSATLSPDQLINKNPSELPQGVDSSKREVGDEE